MDCTDDQSTQATRRGLLNLPPELREQIYELLVVKPQNTVTLIQQSENHDCNKSRICACQPNISKVNRQLRSETLATFYSTNTFLADIGDRDDLATAKRWLSLIRDGNVGNIKRIVLCGYALAPFGHFISRRYVRVLLDLKEGKLEIEEESMDQDPQTTKVIGEMREKYQEMVQARDGRKFDVESVASLMDGFNLLCMCYY